MTVKRIFPHPGISTSSQIKDAPTVIAVPAPRVNRPMPVPGGIMISPSTISRSIPWTLIEAVGAANLGPTPTKGIAQTQVIVLPVKAALTAPITLDPVAVQRRLFVG